MVRGKVMRCRAATVTRGGVIGFVVVAILLALPGAVWSAWPADGPDVDYALPSLVDVYPGQVLNMLPPGAVTPGSPGASITGSPGAAVLYVYSNASGGGEVHIRYAAITGKIQVSSADVGGSVSVYGTGFALDGAPVGPGLLDISSGGVLTGKFENGADIELSFLATGQRILLVDTGGGAAPIVDPFVIQPTALGFETKLTATFTDSDSTSHTASIDWGDGTGPTSGVVVGTTVTASHTYAAAGDAYEVTVTVTDDSDQSGSNTAFAAVYEPTRGVAVGAGWVPEEEAPYGKAFFGFVCRSVWWSDSPWGRMRVRVGDIRFRSTQYDWLITDEEAGMAWFAGSGTINGEGDYYFMVETNADSIWISIFDEYDTGGLVDLGDGWIKIREW